MASQAEESNQKRQLIIFGVVAAAVAAIGGIFLATNKVQQADPTMTAAPPPGPNAVTLHRSEAKEKNWKNGWKTAVPGMIARPKTN